MPLNFTTDHREFSERGRSINEGTPLLGTQRRTLRLKIAGITCCILTTSIASIVVFFTTRQRPDVNSNGSSVIPIHHEDVNLSFSFDVPNKGTGQVIIYNEGNVDVQILGIQFSTSANITQAPIGSLAPIGSTIEQLANEGVWIKYKLTEPVTQRIIIAANSNKQFTYVYNQSLTIVNVGTLPKDVVLETTSNNYAVPLAMQCQNETCNDPFPGKFVGGCYQDQDMFLRQFNASAIKARQLNHIYYSPLSCDLQGNIYLTNEDAASIQLPLLMQLHQQYPYLKINLSIGDKNATIAYPYIANNPAAKMRFINNIFTFLNQYNLSGAEINWQNPKQQDGFNLVSLLRDFSTKFNTTTPHYELSYSGPITPDKISLLGYRIYDFSSYVDSLNIRAYQYNGPGSVMSDYQAPLDLPPNDPNGQGNSITATLNSYLHYVFPREKIVLGIPTNYVGVKVANMNNNGMWQQIMGAPIGQFNETGLYDYACLIGNLCLGGNMLPANCTYLNASQAFMGNYSATPLIMCNTTQLVFTGESIGSIQTKTSYAMHNNFKGISLSSLAADMHNQQSLLQSVDATMNQNKTASSFSENKMTTIHNEQEWQAFTTSISQTLMYSFAGGMAFAKFFQLIDQVTDQAFAKIVSSKDELLLMDKALYYSLKTTVYFSTLYLVGAPLLPTLAGNMITLYMQTILQSSSLQSTISGTVASFCLTLRDKPELHTPQGIALATVTLLTSLAGGYTMKLISDKWQTINNFTHSIYQKSQSWCRAINTFGLFRSPKETTPTLETPIPSPFQGEGGRRPDEVKLNA